MKTKNRKVALSRARRQEIRKKVEKILRECCIAEAPVDVEKVARYLGAKVRFSPFEGELAGMLVRGGLQPVIGVNSLYHLNRRRFTIAHECGHLQLHDQEIFIDRSFRDRSFQIHWRDERSQLAVDPNEVEANCFAAELLMPHKMLEHDLAELDLDIEEEGELRELAQRYKVSLQALMHRLNNLMVEQSDH